MERQWDQYEHPHQLHYRHLGLCFDRLTNRWNHASDDLYTSYQGRNAHAYAPSFIRVQRWQSVRKWGDTIYINVNVSGLPEAFDCRWEMLMAADGVERRAPEGRQRPFYHLRTSIKGKRMPRFYSVRSLWFEHARESSWDRRVIFKITACRFIARDLGASFNKVRNGDLVRGGISCLPEPIKDSSLGGNTIYFVSYLHPLCLTLRPFPAVRVVFNRRFWMDRFLIYVDSEWGIDIYSHTCVTPSIGSRPSMVLANVWTLCIHVPNSKIYGSDVT